MTLSHNVPGIWRGLFLILITCNITGFAGWLMFGMDSVKHSELDQIMATRAPYIHDKQRIQEHFDSNDRRLDRLEARVLELERNGK